MENNSDRSSIESIFWPGVPLGLLSAVLFGASIPFAKIFLGSGINPMLLAGLLYLGSGVGLTGVQFARRAISDSQTEASLRVADLPILGFVVLSGGLVGPVLLMLGLQSIAATSASLMLNLEGLATMVIAWTVFHENVDLRIFLGVISILTGATVLTFGNGPLGFGWGTFLVAGACLAWGIDNNLTQKLSSADPVQIATVKGLVAGTVNLALALILGARFPALSTLAGATVLGFITYGMSLVLFIFALRHLGSARASAYFSTAPFIGAMLALIMFSEELTPRLGVAAMFMGIGVYLHLTERHTHAHDHQALEHEHRHVHDEHHQHAHSPDDPLGEPHTHFSSTCAFDAQP